MSKPNQARPGDRAHFSPFAAPTVEKQTYAEKLRDPRWQRKRLETLAGAGWRCRECGCTDQELQVHHVVYITALDPWDYPDELLLILCDYHHKERQAVEQAIMVEVGKHLAALDVAEMRRQPIMAFFTEDSTLDLLPPWQRELLRHERDADPSA